MESCSDPLFPSVTAHGCPVLSWLEGGEDHQDRTRRVAPRLQRGGRGFESLSAHFPNFAARKWTAKASGKPQVKALK